MPLVEIKKIKKYYPVKKPVRGELKAVDKVSLSIEEGEILGVVGESGCGKSTLARLMMRLVDKTDGEIYFRGEKISDYSEAEMKALRPKMQMVFQNPFSSFNPKLTIGKSLRRVCAFHGIDKEQAEVRLKELFGYAGLDEELLKRRPTELSGGQLQRLAIVRALIPSPEFVVADEPVSALDVTIQGQILELLLKLKEQFGLTMMFISHDLTVVRHMCEWVVVMYLGQIVESGDTETVFSNPRHPYTQALISASPKESPEEETSRILLEGDIPSAMNMPPGCHFASRCPHYQKGICDEEQQVIHVGNEHYVRCARVNEL